MRPVLRALLLRAVLEDPTRIDSYAARISRIAEGNEAELQSLFFAGLCLAGAEHPGCPENLDTSDPVLRAAAKIWGRLALLNLDPTLLEILVL